MKKSSPSRPNLAASVGPIETLLSQERRPNHAIFHRRPRWVYADYTTMVLWYEYMKKTGALALQRKFEWVEKDFGKRT